MYFLLTITKAQMKFFNVCSETHFSKNLHHAETSQLTCTANQSTGFYATRALTENVSEQALMQFF